MQEPEMPGNRYFVVAFLLQFLFNLNNELLKLLQSD
jgi:hypothetical protein